MKRIESAHKPRYRSPEEISRYVSSSETHTLLRIVLCNMYIEPRNTYRGAYWIVKHMPCYVLCVETHTLMSIEPRNTSCVSCLETHILMSIERRNASKCVLNRARHTVPGIVPWNMYLDKYRAKKHIVMRIEPWNTAWYTRTSTSEYMSWCTSSRGCEIHPPGESISWYLQNFELHVIMYRAVKHISRSYGSAKKHIVLLIESWNIYRDTFRTVKQTPYQVLSCAHHHALRSNSLL